MPTAPTATDAGTTRSRDEAVSTGFQIELVARGEATAEIFISGDLLLRDAAGFWRALRKQIAAAGAARTIDIDLSGVREIEGGVMALLLQLVGELQAREVESEIRGAKGPVADVLGLYGTPDKVDLRTKPRTEGMLSQIGRATVAIITEVKAVLSFVGELVLAIFGVLRNPSSMNWSGVFPIMERAGADALPIILLINFLVGFVMGFQGAVQLKQFGANIFVADLVGLAVAREFGPLMAAIIVCGRSGAAFAAEIGTMKVSEEIDALRTMGFGPVRYLVLPRILGLMLVMPLLTLIADAIAMFGGLLVGVFSLDLTPVGYLLETQKAVSAWDVMSGVIKSIFFAFAIALVACQQGLATAGGAEGVGRRTTSSVVAILFSLILIDAAFTVVFYALGL
ncbi:ABC transporter permease [Chondromyces crocatus]|uniref:STAS domain-containing protein n=1 Tax=Chondromyces crocatus TaxID=52 RepID=A0A0K1EH84_CHOCO|nr:MlaE family lipid ABC transporter permease subunit [Chondromyces crocatus]AKT40226.1 uncharacterized protein CMC5_043790 [Chondromyces crocatus]